MVILKKVRLGNVHSILIGRPGYSCRNAIDDRGHARKSKCNSMVLNPSPSPFNIFWRCDFWFLTNLWTNKAFRHYQYVNLPTRPKRSLTNSLAKKQHLPRPGSLLQTCGILRPAIWLTQTTLKAAGQGFETGGTGGQMTHRRIDRVNCNLFGGDPLLCGCVF